MLWAGDTEAEVGTEGQETEGGGVGGPRVSRICQVGEVIPRGRGC